jgi:hypothetical protein
MKRILEGLPFAAATLWLFTSVLVLATWRAPASLPASPPVSPAMPVLAAATAVPPALEITVPTVMITGRAPPRPPARVGTAKTPPHVWRCSGWRALASGPEDQAVRYCE